MKQKFTKARKANRISAFMTPHDASQSEKRAAKRKHLHKVKRCYGLMKRFQVIKMMDSRHSRETIRIITHPVYD